MDGAMSIKTSIKKELESFGIKADRGEITTALDRDGAVILSDLLDGSSAGVIAAELAHGFAAIPHTEQHAVLYPDRIFQDSSAAIDRIADPSVLQSVDSVLLRHCSSYQLSASHAIEIRPDAAARGLEMDASTYKLRIPGVEWQMTAIWAIDELTSSNGAPTLIPGSHRGDKMRMPDSGDMVTVPMSKGSVLLTMGWLLRGWSENRSSAATTTLVNRYCLGWMRPEINFLLTVPRETTDSCPALVKGLLGFASYENGRLGWRPGDGD
jgi:ectoine hydroxylase-related dioxygenase (phytanoyl-CoA dioxygenase family)